MICPQTVLGIASCRYKSNSSGIVIYSVRCDSAVLYCYGELVCVEAP